MCVKHVGMNVCKLCCASAIHMNITYSILPLEDRSISEPHLLLCVVIDKWIHNLPCCHKYVRHMDYKQLPKSFWVVVLPLTSSC